MVFFVNEGQVKSGRAGRRAVVKFAKTSGWNKTGNRTLKEGNKQIRASGYPKGVAEAAHMVNGAKSELAEIRAVLASPEAHGAPCHPEVQATIERCRAQVGAYEKALADAQAELAAAKGGGKKSEKESPGEKAEREKKERESEEEAARAAMKEKQAEEEMLTGHNKQAEQDDPGKDDRYNAWRDRTIEQLDQWARERAEAEAPDNPARQEVLVNQSRAYRDLGDALGRRDYEAANKIVEGVNEEHTQDAIQNEFGWEPVTGPSDEKDDPGKDDPEPDPEPEPEAA